MSAEQDRARSKKERIVRLRLRLERVARPMDLAAVLKGVLDLLEDEL